MLNPPQQRQELMQNPPPQKTERPLNPNVTPTSFPKRHRHAMDIKKSTKIDESRPQDR